MMLRAIYESTLQNSRLLITFLLTLGVVFVNGWTDAPNAIASCVSTRAIHPKKAVLMSAFFNLAGVITMTLFNAKVAFTIKNTVNFEGDTSLALTALCAAMTSIIIWSVLAWYFGIPTSESHALAAGLSGAAIALRNSFDGINKREWISVFYGLAISTLLGFILGFTVAKLTQFVCKKTDRRKTLHFFDKAQIFGGAAMSFMHGAQDGQKFIGVLMLGIALAKGEDSSSATLPPIWLLILVSAVMALGTSAGGYKIIKAVGMDMVKPEKYQGFSADTAGACCLLFSSLFGIPVSTTHTKTSALMGAGAAKRPSSVNLGIVWEMVLTWVLTFPGCGLLGYITAKIFIIFFN